MNRRSLVQRLSMSLLSTKLLSSLPAESQELTVRSAPQKPVSANDRINVAVIGPGSRGLELMRKLLRTPGVEITGVCDVYEPRFAQVNALVGKKVPAYRDYRELLARKEVDAVFIASPPTFHAEQVIASIESGRPVYGEKTLAFRPDECHKVAETIAKHKQIFQIGHQYRYASWYQEAIKRIHGGEIGEPTHVYGYWHRSDNWRRPVPSPDLDRLLNWRLYKETSGGLFEELGSHHIEVANWVFSEHPQTVLGTTSIAVSKDGRSATMCRLLSATPVGGAWSSAHCPITPWWAINSGSMAPKEACNLPSKTRPSMGRREKIKLSPPTPTWSRKGSKQALRTRPASPCPTAALEIGSR